MPALPLASAHLSKLSILCLNDLIDGGLCRNFFYFHVFYFFLVFKHDFVRCVDFTRVESSNTASDDLCCKLGHT